MAYPTQLYCGKRTPSQIRRIEPVENYLFKPKGGLWTSTYSETEGSAWVRRCAEGMPEWLTENCYLIEIGAGAKVYEVDSYEDLARLRRRYPDRKSPFKVFVAFKEFVDWTKVARDYDGVHLTEHGQRATRFTEPSLYGWDVECTVWFKDVFKSIRRLKLDLDRIRRLCKLKS